MKTKKHLLGATVTAYWIPYDESDVGYWNEKPADNEYGVIWDSTEFSQKNPLTTDMSGWYSWDVPEGWWRVKCEMEGYETTWSDWVPVPPPQMEVHIGMTPIADEEGSGVTVSGTVTCYGDETAQTVLKVMDSLDVVVAETTAATDTGAYQFENVEAGSYSLQVSKTNHVTREYAITITDEAIVQDVELHLLGDVSGDGKITAKDKRMIYNHIDGASLLTEYDLSVGDVSGDGKVTAKDKRIIYNHIDGASLLW